MSIFIKPEPDTPITQGQRDYLHQLITNGVLDEREHRHYSDAAESNISYGTAEGLIEELKKKQLDLVSLARIGRLKMVDLNKALKQLVNRDNT